MQFETYPQTFSLPSNEAADSLPETTRILDIRQERVEVSLQSTICGMLSIEEKEKMQMPFELLYNAKGLQFFEQITYLEDYYPTNHELEILQHSADELARNFSDGSIIVELGSGYV